MQEIKHHIESAIELLDTRMELLGNTKERTKLFKAAIALTHVLNHLNNTK
jgi:hypothetical protein